MLSRRCVFRCERQTTLFGLPIEEILRNQWLNFIYNAVPDQHSLHVRLCAAHFTDDCFMNMGEYKAGCAQRLRLKSGSIPTLHVLPGSSDSQPIVKGSPLLAPRQSSRTKTKSTETPERIQANPESDRRCAKTIIDIGSAFALWQNFRDENGFKTDTELAFYLLSRTACCADFSARCKKRKLEPLNDVPTHLQMEECESESSQPRNGHHCTDEDMEVPEIAYEIPPPYQTDEPVEIEASSKDQIKSGDQIKSESQIKLEHQSSAPALKNEDIILESSTSAIKNEIKEEPAETEVQPENRLEVSMDSVNTSDKITPSFGKTINPVSVAVKEENTEKPLVPNKTNFTGLFRTCIQCGEPVQEYTTGSSGSLNQLQWKCSNGHLMCLFPNNNPTQTHTHPS